MTAPEREGYIDRAVQAFEAHWRDSGVQLTWRGGRIVALIRAAQKELLG